MRGLVSFELNFADEVDPGLESFVTGMPGGRTNQDAIVVTNKLCGLNLAQNLGNATTNTIVVEFVGDQLAVRVNDEATAQGEALFLDIGPEGATN